MRSLGGSDERQGASEFRVGSCATRGATSPGGLPFGLHESEDGGLETGGRHCCGARSGCGGLHPECGKVLLMLGLQRRERGSQGREGRDRGAVLVDQSLLTRGHVNRNRLGLCASAGRGDIRALLAAGSEYSGSCQSERAHHQGAPGQLEVDCHGPRMARWGCRPRTGG